MKQFLFFICALLCLSNCQNDKKSNKTENKTVNRVAELSTLSPEVLSELNKSCTSIDVISLKKEVNASMSFSNAQAIQYVISFITDEKGFLSVCPPDAHLVFQKNGEITHEADIYFSGQCNAIVWTDGTKMTHANKFTPEGVDFFKNFLKPRNPNPPDSAIQQQ
ncbi:MAG: hypothetical protein IPM48_00645 [Saprospiraceae bacterium]|nr:hypothetical protein [Saprospiraceae bacterium]